MGNRTTRVVGATTETFNYPSTSNRLSGTTISGSPARTISYLSSGQISQNLRGGSTTYDFTYNDNGRLSSAALNSVTVGAYLHNWLEQRVAKTASSTTTHYVLDRMGHLLSENTGAGAPIREYLWLDDMPVAQVDHSGMSPVVYYVHTDHLGRPQKMSDGADALVWDAVFQPFGEAYSVSGTATNLLMFPGQFYDSETALAQNWRRDYDATLGRYIQSDPIGLAGGINTYAYVDGNPLGYVDPTGEAALGGALGGVIGGGLGGLGGGALGGAAGTFVGPGGGTAVGAALGGRAGGIAGAQIGKAIGSAVEDYMLAMAAQRSASRTKSIPAQDDSCRDKDDCDRERDEEEGACWENYGSVFGPGDWRYRACMERAFWRWEMCYRGMPNPPPPFGDRDIDGFPTIGRRGR